MFSPRSCVGQPLRRLTKYIFLTAHQQAQYSKCASSSHNIKKEDESQERTLQKLPTWQNTCNLTRGSSQFHLFISEFCDLDCFLWDLDSMVQGFLLLRFEFGVHGGKHLRRQQGWKFLEKHRNLQSN
ncbi:unnamed protein product, partial [Vitis vinifera]|uniref:Uncharacterized protein n=1 Tax=Vitis vinifera TaxID=29760 RepID=D7U896_VITVI